MVLQILMSIILGLLPEVLYFTMFIICTKDIKEKKIRLGVLISIAYILCMFVQRYKVIYYILFIVLVYAILKLLYKKKTQIIDIFVFSLSFIYVSLVSYLGYIFFKDDLSNYYIMYIIARILLFIPFIFKNKFNAIYRKYCSLWNRNDKMKRPIKSITLRNISLITINVAIFLMNLYAMSVINFIQ